MLIIVEDGNREFLAQAVLDVEAVGGLDVLQVDPAHRRFQQLAEADYIVGILAADLHVEDVDVGEALEEHRLALHDRLGRQRPDVAQPQDRGAVADHRHQVAAIRVAEYRAGVLVDLPAGFGHPRGVGETEVMLGCRGLGGVNLQLSRPTSGVIVEGLAERLAIRHWHPPAALSAYSAQWHRTKGTSAFALAGAGSAAAPGASRTNTGAAALQAEHVVPASL